MRRTMALVAGVILALAAVTAATAGVRALITGAQIKDGTIQSRDIANRTIRTRDMTSAAIASLRGLRGATGPAGATGATGAQGPAGPAGPQGPTGAKGATGDQGPQGDKGDPGTGVNVTGSVATEADLPDDADVGDAYIALDTRHLWLWDGTDWVDTGLVRGPAGPQGETGPAGPAGPQGETGEQGPAGGLTGYEIVQGDPVAIDASEFDVPASVECPAGKVVLGGGATVDDSSLAVLFASSAPFENAGTFGWAVVVQNFEDADNAVTVYAICGTEAA
jgi:hypothetical protein